MCTRNVRTTRAKTWRRKTLSPAGLTGSSIAQCAINGAPKTIGQDSRASSHKVMTMSHGSPISSPKPFGRCERHSIPKSSSVSNVSGSTSIAGLAPALATTTRSRIELKRSASAIRLRAEFRLQRKRTRGTDGAPRLARSRTSSASCASCASALMARVAYRETPFLRESPQHGSASRSDTRRSAFARSRSSAPMPRKQFRTHAMRLR